MDSGGGAGLHGARSVQFGPAVLDGSEFVGTVYNSAEQ